MNTILQILITFSMMFSVGAFSPFAEFQAIELEAIHNKNGGQLLSGRLSPMMYFLSNDQIENSVDFATEAPILVVGATGKVGREIVHHLIEDHVPVRALVRDREKAGELFFEYLGGRSSLELVVCDLDTADKQSIAAATAGCACVINLSGKHPEVFQEQGFMMSNLED